MKKGDKIILIKNISAKLSSLDWTDIDLTLRQFNLPWSPTWDGPDKIGYCMFHVEQGDIDTLLELYEYLHGGKQFSATVKDDAKHPWKTGCFNLFCSHISADKVLLKQVKYKLFYYGVDAFVAHEDIRPTKEWESVILAALETCDALAAFLTPDFHKSNWTDQEVGYCLKRRLLIIPVKIGLDPYGFMGRYQALTKHKGNPDDITTGIVNILIEHDLTAAKMAKSIVSLFENSMSFAEARTNIDLVKKIKVWTPNLLQRIEAAPQKNRQISESWGVPDQIREIVSANSK